MKSTGLRTRLILVMDGNGSQHRLHVVLGRSTRSPDASGECSTTPAHSTRDARSTVGTVPMLWPYRMILSAAMPNLQCSVLLACTQCSALGGEAAEDGVNVGVEVGLAGRAGAESVPRVVVHTHVAVQRL